MTKNQVPLVERAYELAKSGRFATVQSIRVQLKAEGHSQNSIQLHLEGLSIRAALTKLCKSARDEPKA